VRRKRAVLSRYLIVLVSSFKEALEFIYLSLARKQRLSLSFYPGIRYMLPLYCIAVPPVGGLWQIWRIVT
jgi:hypothetical protein